LLIFFAEYCHLTYLSFDPTLVNVFKNWAIPFGACAYDSSTADIPAQCRIGARDAAASLSEVFVIKIE